MHSFCQPLFQNLERFWTHFDHFGTLLELLLQPWVHFWSTLDALFVSKIRLRCQTCPKSHHHQNILPHVGTFWRHFFIHFSIFMQTDTYLQHVLFFLRFVGRPGRSTRGAHMQSVHACAVQTHFFVFSFFLKIWSLKGAHGVKFGVYFSVFVDISVKNGASKNVSKKGVPPDSNTTLFQCQEAP